jgi:DNA polymerase I-like protein with 3'-5' exonuclease and polymerase domains
MIDVLDEELPVEGEELEQEIFDDEEEDPGLPYLRPQDVSPALNVTLVEDGAGLDKVKDFFKRLAAKEKYPTLDWDYETNVVPNFWERRPRVLAVGDKEEQYVIDFLPFAGSTDALVNGLGNYNPAAWARPVVDVLKPVLESGAILKVGQNLSFEYEVSAWNLGIHPWNMYSVDIAERVKWAGLHSFKHLPFFSLAKMVERYFHKRLDKTLQTSYDLESPITEGQLVYSAFDLRGPRGIRMLQLQELVPQNLYRVTKIENDAIGAFVDMHMRGMRVDKVAWRTLIAEWSAKYREAIERLDTHLLPVVGSKHIPETDLTPMFDRWKDLSVDSAEELELKLQRKATKKDTPERAEINARLLAIETQRKAARDAARQKWQSTKTRQREVAEMADKCLGEAAINLNSPKQLRAALLKIKGFTESNLPETNDDVLKKHKSKPVVGAIRDIRKYGKLIQTYGESWVTTWSYKPSNEEGWVSPHDDKIHSIIQQLEAETGRTSSVKPNSQNLPHDPRVRACFVADPPREDIRVSDCCEADAAFEGATGGHRCTSCGLGCSTHPEEQVMVTVDMSGAELRIIAEDSGAPSWVQAFLNGWDVHSVGTELLYPEEWPTLAAKPGDLDEKGQPLPECAYFNKDHKKCKCPGHLAKRDDNKATNFQLAYGGTEKALAEAIDKTESEAHDLMVLHRKKNPHVWAYLEKQEQKAKHNLEARDRSGRRRKFEEPNWDNAKAKARQWMFERAMKKAPGRLADGREYDKKGKLADGTKITKEHFNPDNRQIQSALRSMWGSIGRQGRNMPIQGLNATIAKLAMGAGFDKDGKGYMWHLLREIPRAYLINFVHDEYVIQCPKRYAPQVLALVGDCIKRAAAEFMFVIPMESEGRIEKFWKK